MSPPASPVPHRPAARRCRTGRGRRTTCRPRSARSRPRSGPGSRPPAAPSRRSSPSSSGASRQRSSEIAAARQRGETIWPVIDYADIAAGTVPREALALLQPPRLPRRARPLRPRAGPRLGPRHRRLRRAQPLLRELPRPRRRLLRQRRLQARDLPGLLVAGADAGPPERPDGPRAVVPQPPVEARVRRHAVVRPGPRLAVPGPHPPPAAGRQLRRPGHPPRPRHARPVDDRGLPAGVPAPVRRHRRAVRPVGRRPPHRRPAVPRHDHVLGVPHLPGLDRAVRHGPRPGRAAHRADPRSAWPT